MKVVDFETFKQEKSDKDKANELVKKFLSDPMQSLYVDMIKQFMSEAIDGMVDGLGELKDVGLTRESSIEIVDSYASELYDAYMAFEYIADELRREESE